jgi:hypothetical protein
MDIVASNPNVDCIWSFVNICRVISCRINAIYVDLIFFMEKKLLKRLFLFCVIFLFSFLFYKFLYSVSEKYFFDKFFYKKSVIHGYLKKGEWNALKFDNNPQSIEDRIADLRLLADQEQQTGQILGSFTQDDESKDLYKIALIGDSFVYGTGVRFDQTLGQILEGKLNKIRPTKVYILAQVGDSIVDHYAKFLLAEKYLDPDLNIFLMVGNDLAISIYDRTRYPGKDIIFDSLAFDCRSRSLYDYQPDGNDTTEADKGSFSEKYANVCFLRRIINDINAKSKDVIFYSGCSCKILEEGQEIEYPTDGFCTNIAKQGGTLLTYDNVTGDVYLPSVSKKEAHPSKEAHQIHAESMFKEITTNPRWKFQ